MQSSQNATATAPVWLLVVAIPWPWPRPPFSSYYSRLRVCFFYSGPIIAMAFSPPRTAIKVGITASHDGGNIEIVSIGEPVISGRTAKVTVSVDIKPGEWMELHS